jgi:hypothetical protein
VPEGIRGAWPLGLGLVALTAVVLGLVAWAQWCGDAGSQRGLVIRSEVPGEIVVTLADGRSARLGEDRQHTFVVRRDEFPQMVRAVDASGAVVAERELEYEWIVDAEFRISVDRGGFYHTDLLRETPRAE